MGRINQRTETIEGVTTTWTYSYDTAIRLARVDRNGTLYESYGYDSNDNRVSVTRPTGTTVATFDDQDRIQTNGSASYTHDANGHLVSKTHASGATLFSYEATGQLLSVTKPNGDIVSYDLGANNRRFIKRVNGSIQKKWLFADDFLPVAEYDSNDNLVATFNGGYMVKDGVTYRILRDQLGSVRLVVEASTGNIVQRLSYGPWGTVLEDTNPGFQPFGYAGGLYDPDTTLVRFGARDYDPETGRWTTKDPSGLLAGMNTYQYVDADPVNYLDPIGHSKVRDVVLIIEDRHLDAINYNSSGLFGGRKITKAEIRSHFEQSLRQDPRLRNINALLGHNPNCPRDNNKFYYVTLTVGMNRSRIAPGEAEFGLQEQNEIWSEVWDALYDTNNPSRPTRRNTMSAHFPQGQPMHGNYIANRNHINDLLMNQFEPGSGYPGHALNYSTYNTNYYPSNPTSAPGYILTK
ncbi:MAG: RHS repeat-associated core domain-containing protein [Candidatus Eremiobacterota bacterium]